MNYVTLTSADPEFKSYLLGTFSKTHRALPVETYSAHAPFERVTFQLVPVEQIKSPSWWRIYFRAARPELLPLTLGPAIVAWLSHPQSLPQWTRWPSWCAILGIFFLHVATFLFNDVHDHLRGGDRANLRRGSRVIQKGWVTAEAMRRWAWVNFGLAFLFGVPAFLNAPLPLLGVCALAASALIILTRNIGTAWGLCDVSLFLLFGPLLTLGTAMAGFRTASEIDLLTGLAFGTLSLWIFQIRQFENLFRARSESFRTFLGFRTFDRARQIVIAEGVLILMLQVLIAVTLRSPLLFIALVPLISWPHLLTLDRLYRAASPLSSRLVRVSRLALIAHVLWTGWWILIMGVQWL